MSYLMVMIIALVLGFATQAYINSSYSKYSRVSNGVGMTGAQAARRMLDDNGLYDVSIQAVAGTLTDHYDPRTRTVRLSQGIYGSSSVSALAVACHECGHAVQHAVGYVPMKARSALVPVANAGSSVWLILLIIGFALNSTGIMWAGIILFAVAVLFHIVTLPVEFNASSRGLAYIKSGAGVGYAMPQETFSGASTVLRAAALTYVASALTSVMQLLYFVGLASNRR